MNLQDLNLIPALIPLPPLLAFVVIILFAARNRLLTHIIAIGAILTSWVLSFYAVVTIVTQHKDLGLGNNVFGMSTLWLSNNANDPLSGALRMGVFLDPLNTIMLFMVPLACLLIFIYSLGYMAHDPRNTRFFAYLSLFAGAMLTLVVADNLLLLFVGWEVMGLCSYLLIGFWYEKPSAYKAAIKAFMTTRVGDVIMMMGIAYLWVTTGTLNFRTILHSPEVLERLAATPALGALFNGGFLGLSAAALIGICIVFGTIGKSAQFPLHVWLPDAMEGPTPVSAMIHAAAMVSAGIYLIIRMYPLLSAGGHPHEGILTAPMVLMAVVGGFTALFAATIALAQNDIKKVLAYSTISQLGFMMAALGIGAYVAAAFHLITHAFFKALLFMGSGSVIHAMEHGEHVAHAAHGGHGAHGHDDHAAHSSHDSHDAHGHDAHAAEHAAEAAHAKHDHEEHDAAPAFDPQDMRNMGGLGRNMPVTMWTFIIGGASLAGFPLLTAGFWSKDEILADAFNVSKHTPIALFVLVCLSLAAILTALYTFRQIAMTFWFAPRTEAAKFAQHNDGTAEARNVSAQMTAPLIVLAFFAIVAGFAGVNPGFPVFGPLVHSIIGTDTPFADFIGRTLIEAPEHLAFNWWPVIISLSVFTIGAGLGYMMYGRKPYDMTVPDPMESALGPDIHRILRNKYYVDEFYVAALVRPLRWVGEVFTNQILDKGIIDGIIHGVANGATWLGNLIREFNRVVIDGVGDGIPAAVVEGARTLRGVQSGHIQQYLLYSLIAALWVGANLVIMAAAPQLVAWAIIAQAVIVVLVILYFNMGRSRAQG